MLRALCLSFALSCPMLASAEPLSFSGSVAIGATDIMGGSGIGLIDATLAIPLTSRVPLDLEIGTYLYALDGKRPHETYGALTWDDTWRLGAVRPAYDAVLVSVFTRAAPYLAYERAEYTRAHATVEAMRRTAVPWGVSWTEGFDRTDVAVSAHTAIKGGFQSGSVSILHRGEGWQLAAAVEAIWGSDGSQDGLNTKLGGRHDFGQADFGLTWLHPEANDRPDALALDMVARVSSRLDVLAFGEFSKDGQDDAYGLGLDYHARADSSVLFSMTDGARGDAVHLTLERRF
jgi:hypothetical protein